MGIVDDNVKALLDRCRREVDEGRLPACQVALAYEGEVVVDETYGAPAATRFPVYSCTKPFVAAAVWHLLASGDLELDRRVADYLPGFASNGKDVVTVEQVLLHTSGFPQAPLKHPQWADRDGRHAAFSRWRLNWEPGTAYDYHPTSAHWVLAELIAEVTGHDYRDVLEERVTGPLGLRRILGIGPDDQDDIAPLVPCGAAATPEEMEAATGFRALPVGEVTDAALLAFNRPDVREVGVPGGGGVMRAADLALFYQALLHNPGGLWDPAVLADATGHVRNTFTDPLMGMPANRTLGLVVAGEDGQAFKRGLGRTVSPRAFGHDGANGSVSWADPATGLSFGFTTNGLDADFLGLWRRVTAVASRAGVCAE